LEIAYVARGWLQLYFNLDLKPWDTAGAAVIIREVGGELFDYDGNIANIDTPSIFAAHPDILKELQSFLPSR
jgi:myo-inositol-1(or 4)-monophosphatase